MFISPKDNKTTTIDVETVNDNEHQTFTATPEYNDKEIVVSYEDVGNHQSEQYNKHTSEQLEGHTSDRGHVIGLNEYTRYRNGIDPNQEYTEQIHKTQNSPNNASKQEIPTENTAYKNGLDFNQENTEHIHIEQGSLTKASKKDTQTSILHRYIPLFRNPRMCLFFISQLLFFSGFLIPFIYVPDKAKGHGELM